MTYKERLLKRCSRHQDIANVWCVLAQCRFNFSERSYDKIKHYAPRPKFKVKMLWLWDRLAEKLAKEILVEQGKEVNNKEVNKLLDYYARRR